MPMMALNLALLFVLQLAALQLFFWHGENLLHGFFEFLGRVLLGCGQRRLRCLHASNCTA